jgi:hypothetical protein
MHDGSGECSKAAAHSTIIWIPAVTRGGARSIKEDRVATIARALSRYFFIHRPAASLQEKCSMFSRSSLGPV